MAASDGGGAMKHRCPKCGHRWESKAKNQAKGGASRWAGMTKAERSAEMKRVRAARLANTQGVTRPLENQKPI